MGGKLLRIDGRKYEVLDWTEQFTAPITHRCGQVSTSRFTFTLPVEVAVSKCIHIEGDERVGIIDDVALEGVLFGGMGREGRQIFRVTGSLVAVEPSSAEAP
jgi:hypothetical protein